VFGTVKKAVPKYLQNHILLNETEARMKI